MAIVSSKTTTFLLSDNSVHSIHSGKQTHDFIAELTVFGITRLYSEIPALI